MSKRNRHKNKAKNVLTHPQGNTIGNMLGELEVKKIVSEFYENQNQNGGKKKDT